MPLITNVDNYKATATADGWLLSCPNNPEMWFCRDFTSSVYHAVQYALCQCGNHGKWWNTNKVFAADLLVLGDFSLTNAVTFSHDDWMNSGY